MEKLTIGGLAEQCGVTIDTIRYYERSRLVQPLSHSKSGYRLYNEDSIRQVIFIKRCKELGFTLSEIKKLLALTSSKDASYDEMLKCTHNKIAETENKLKELIEIGVAINGMAGKYRNNTPVNAFPILDHVCPGRYLKQSDFNI